MRQALPMLMNDTKLQAHRTDGGPPGRSGRPAPPDDAPAAGGRAATIGVVAVLLALLAAAAAVGWWAWAELADIEMSMHGYVALAIGVVATLGLGMGLMWLVYFSHRRGFDDEAGHD